MQGKWLDGRNVLIYALKHKWFVFLECLAKAQASPNLKFFFVLVWRGIVHDMDKLLPWMLKAYAERFKGDISKGRDKTGYYDPHVDAPAAFELAFFKHTRKNDHHWQHWVMAGDNGKEIRYPMPREAVVEMICDWRGAARAQGAEPNPWAWFEVNAHKMRLHHDTLSSIIEELDRW